MNINLDVLKFRVWDTTRDCFYPNEHGELHWSLEDTILEEADNDFIREMMIIERCTGLKDMNGNLIFEGDKILFVENLPGGFDLTHKIVVAWDNERGLWSPFNKISPQFVTIIGNVHR
jgi:hypothetical protein